MDMGRSDGCTGQLAANEHQEIKTMNFRHSKYLKYFYITAYDMVILKTF
jgi:hypothetical protein